MKNTSLNRATLLLIASVGLVATVGIALGSEAESETKFRPDELAAMSIASVGLRPGNPEAATTNDAPAPPIHPILGAPSAMKNSHAKQGGHQHAPASAAKSKMATEINPESDPAADEEVQRRELARLQGDLEAARYLRSTRQASAAIPLLEKLLFDDKPEFIRQGALLELAYGAQDQNELPRAQNIYGQFVSRWPTDSRVPEILLRVGRNFRQMGLNTLALAKFYGVMTAALSLKSDQLPYYQKLVLQAQAEIAETNYQMGKFADAADFFGRLLKQSDPALDRPQTQYRLVTSLAAAGKSADAAQQAQDFLNRYPEAPQQPEVRFLLAQALKQTGRNGDALQQVLVLLQEQKTRTKNQPEVWAYWQQRAGNEIGNQLYRDGDYPSALNVYQALAELDTAPAWRLPVTYQIGMTYERLLQPARAIEVYQQILAEQAKPATNDTPNLKAVFEMARWRAGFLQWQTKADSANHVIANPPPLASTSALTNSATANIAYR